MRTRTTCDRIEQYARRAGPNPWVMEEIRYPTLRERFYHLVFHCDAVIALTGGVGTLSEIALSWSLVQTGEIAPKPMILIGRTWQLTMNTFLMNSEGYVNGEHQQLLTLVDDEIRAIWHLRQAFHDTVQR